MLIDNARELVSPQLAKVITDNIWQARVLGHSRDALLRVECAWGATGINPQLHQEIVRRTVHARLDSGTERPWMRTGFSIPDLRGWTRENRGRLVWAYLTLARAWFAAGCPKGTTSITFSAPTRFDKLFSGVTCPRPAWMPTQVDSSDGITAADTFDADYGRLLERATQRIYVKGMASPTGFEPVFWP